jgi:hypothetical protein
MAEFSHRFLMRIAAQVHVHRTFSARKAEGLATKKTENQP